MAKSQQEKDAQGAIPFDPAMNLHQRIRAVMTSVRRLQKDKAVGSGNYAYKAMSEEKVTTVLREAMIEYGLTLVPISQVHTMQDYQRPGRNGEMTIVSLSTVDVTYKLTNVDDPSEFEVICSSGTGVDPQDKGVGKAMTYSYKYALLRTFAIPTGQDPDSIHNDELATQQSGGGKPVELAQPTMKVESQAPANEQPDVKYATAKQKEEIIRLLNNPVITRAEKTKTLLVINRLTDERAQQSIDKLHQAIAEREEEQRTAA